MKKRTPIPAWAINAITFSLVLFIAVIAFFAGRLSITWLPGTAGRFALLNQVYNLLEQQGLPPMPEHTLLEYGAVNGLVQAYNDPYTVFVEPPQAEIQTNLLAGSYGGIGARIERDAQNRVLLYPYPESPAALAGINDADQLIAVDGFVISVETSMDEIIAAIRGPVGENIEVTIARYSGYTQFEALQIVRAEVALPSTTYNLLPDMPSIGIIHLSVIAETTPDELRQAVAALSDQGAQGFILDLRNNGGGLVESGVSTVQLFAVEGAVFEQDYKNRNPETTVIHTRGEFSDLDLVILVNQNTASAAEIIAGALQSQKQAMIVGTTTYGKNSIQLVFSLSDGSSLHVTAAQWSIPGLSGFGNGTGLKPDIVLAVDAPDVEYIQAAVNALNK
jgi:carboxyl-terminal processing protease